LGKKYLQYLNNKASLVEKQPKKKKKTKKLFESREFCGTLAKETQNLCSIESSATQELYETQKGWKNT
jgi:hypothetical protein